jgi:hypothetical protein
MKLHNRNVTQSNVAPRLAYLPRVREVVYMDGGMDFGCPWWLDSFRTTTQFVTKEMDLCITT